MSHQRPLRALLQDGVIWRKYQGAPGLGFRAHETLQGVWKNKCDDVFGNRLNEPPPSGRYVFGCCSALEAAFLFVNLTTTSPFLFERCMPYHLKYTGLSLAFWGSTYAALDISRYNMSRGPWRSLVGVAFFCVGTTSIIAADYRPWPSYGVLTAAFAAMNFYDYKLHMFRYAPPWIFRWKVGFNLIALASLVIGVAKGRYLETYAEWYIMREAGRLMDEED